MEIKLKPCPFCGAEAKVGESAGKKFAFVVCTNGLCACQIDLFHGRDRKEQAAQRWNRRVINMREDDGR